MNAACHNCGTPAMFEVGPPAGRVRLCLNCYTRLVNAATARSDMIQRHMDQVEAEAYVEVGLPPPEHLLRPPVQVHTGPLNVSNIQVRDSNIGVLNTGHLAMVGSWISVLAQKGETGLTAALTDLTRAVIESSEISAEQKNEIIELLSGIASEAVAPRERRRRTVLRSLIQSLATAIGVASGLITIWDKVRPMVEALAQACPE